MKKFSLSISAIVLIAVTCNSGTRALAEPQSFNPIQPANSNSGSIPQNNTFVTLQGKRVCLPHKDTTGPQTQECAIGFQDIAGNYYAIHNLTPPNWNGTSLSGTFVADTTGNYAIVGYIIFKAAP